MFVADHVIRSIADPHDRSLVFIDEDKATREVLLPKNPHEILQFDGKMYDYWGREVIIGPEIKHIIRGVGRGCYCFLDQAPVFLVEKQNGNLAFAAISYVYKDSDQLCPFEPLRYHPMDGIVGSAKLICSRPEGFREVSYDFFKGTPIGDIFDKLGLEYWLAYLADTTGAVIVGNPYEDVYHEVRNSPNGPSIYSGSTSRLYGAHLVDHGRKLVGKIKAYDVYNQKQRDRLLTVELSADWLD